MHVSSTKTVKMTVTRRFSSYRKSESQSSNTNN